MDAAAHMDVLMQGFTLIHRPEEDIKNKVSLLNPRQKTNKLKWNCPKVSHSRTDSYFHLVN